MCANSFFDRRGSGRREQHRAIEVGALWLILFVLLFSSCTLRDRKLTEGRTTFLFAKKELAVKLLTADPAEGYFERVNKLDIGIQLKRCLPDTLSRRAAVELLRASLADDIGTFSEREEALLLAQLQIIRQWVGELNPDMLTDTVYLVKTGGRHYGPGAFYTRGKAIILPEAALRSPHLPALRRTLLHELFHLYARYRPLQKVQLYQLIGFTRLDGPARLPDTLAARLLLNPDGLERRFAIRLQEIDRLALPVLVANEPCYRPGKEGFFAYANFRLSPVSRDGKAAGAGAALLDFRNYPSFFQQVGDNTSYVIHPDEILADNFALLFQLKYDKEAAGDLLLSGRGAEVIEGMEEILAR